VDRAIIDTEVTVGQRAVVGDGDASVANHDRPDIVHAGISIVGKRVVIPAGLHVGRNVVIGPGVNQELVGRHSLESGESVHPTHMPVHLFV
jgi:glucose-1-phosphate adenylyltransferase